MLKRLDLIGRSIILERVQLCVRKVTRSSFSERLQGVACDTRGVATYEPISHSRTRSDVARYSRALWNIYICCVYSTLWLFD